MVFNDWIQSIFPNFRGGAGYLETSPCTDEYNCIAWAAGDDEKWWWPHPDSFWPEGVVCELTPEAFIQAYQTCSFEVCEDAGFEPGFEKIAIYTDLNGVPTHASRQKLCGKWTSKLGTGFDIDHDTLTGIENDTYGVATIFMKRPIS